MLAPQHHLRVEKCLEAQNLPFTKPSNQVINAEAANAHYTYDLSNPEVYQVIATWKGLVTEAADINELFEAISECNTTRFCPRAYTVEGPISGSYRLVAESNILASPQLTDKQFYTFIETSVRSIVEFFREVEERIPHLVTWKDGGVGGTFNS